MWVGLKDVYYLCADLESIVIYGLFVFFALARGSYSAYLSMSLLLNTNRMNMIPQDTSAYHTVCMI